MLHDLKALRTGPLRLLISQVMALPKEERRNYEIEKAGDHRLDYQEIAALASRPDFPRE